MYLVAALIAVSLVDCLAQFGVVRASLAEVLAEQVAPSGGQTSSRACPEPSRRDGVDLHPFAVLQAAFGHHEVDVGFEAQVTAISVDGVDYANADTRIQLVYQFADDPSAALRTGLGPGLQEDLQAGAVGVEARPQQVVSGEGDVEVRDFEEITGNVVNPIVDAHLAAGRAEAGLAGERDMALVLATGADIAGITGIGIAAGYETLDDLSDVGTLVRRDFVFQALVAPGVPVIAKDLTEEVVAGGVMRINCIRWLLPRR